MRPTELDLGFGTSESRSRRRSASEISVPVSDLTEESNELLSVSDIDIPISPSPENYSQTSPVQEQIFIVPRKPLPSYTTVVEPVENDLDSDSHVLTLDRTLLSWRPLYLRLPVLFGFVLVFCVLIVCLEVILQESRQKHGLATSTERLHYLWTYGPSAVFIFTGALWARVEYQTKEIAPWRSFAGVQAEATKSVLLDYVSAFLPTAIYTSISNRHTSVALATICGLLLKIVTVFSTALLILGPTKLPIQNVPITISSAFNGSFSTLNSTGDTPYLLLSGIQRYGLKYPLGVTGELAYQSFNSSPEFSNSTLETTVDAIAGSLECEEAQLFVTSLYEELDDTIYGHSEPVTLSQVTWTAGDCSIHDVPIYYLFDFSANGSSYFGIYQGGHCGNSTLDIDGRIVIAAGSVEQGAANTTSLNTTTISTTNITVTNSRQFLCRPVVNITGATLNINESDSSSAAVQTSSNFVPKYSSLNNLTGYSFVKIEPQYSDLVSNRLVNVTFTDVNSAAVEIDPRLEFGMMQAGMRDISFASLMDGDNLVTVVDRYYRVIVALFSHLSLSRDISIVSSADATTNQLRLQVKELSVRVMEAVLALVVLLTVWMMMNERNSYATPTSPSTLLRVAALIRNSESFLGMLRGTGSAGLKHLQHHLAGRRYTSGVFNENNELKFTIHVNHFEKPIIFTQDTNEKLGSWQPFIVSRVGRSLACLVLIVLVTVLELLLLFSREHQGFSDVSLTGYTHYSWSYLPAGILVLTSMWLSAIDFNIRCLGPYFGLMAGTTASNTVLLSYLDEISTTTLVRALKRRHWAVCTTSLATLIGSVLTIAVSGVFVTENVSYSSSIALQASTIFAQSSDDIWNNTPNDGQLPLEPYAASISSLILAANLSYPPWTYDDLAFPQLSITGRENVTSNGTVDGNTDTVVSTRVTATRPNYICQTYDKDQIVTNLTWSSGGLPFQEGNNLLVNIAQEICPGDGFGTTIGQNEVFAFSAMYLGCASNAYIWGHSSGGQILSLSAAVCNETFEDVETDLTLTGPSLSISTTNLPVPDDSTVQPSLALWTNLASSMYVYLQMRQTPANSNLDAFFSYIVNGRDGVSLSDLIDSTKVDKVLDSIRDANGVLRAQYFSVYTRIPINSTTATPATKSTLVNNDRLRLVQDAAASRVLEGLLIAILICMLVSIITANTKNVVAKNPCSIAAQASLLADSRLVAVDSFLGAGADRISDTELAVLAKTRRFQIGWFNQKAERGVYKVERGVYKVDVVESGDVVSSTSSGISATQQSVNDAI